MIDLALVKSHLRVDGTEEDALIQAYIDAAISAFEAWTNRKLVTVLPETVENHLLITAAIQQGALLLIGHWYANRESVAVGVSVAEMPMATKSLWLPHRWACV
ncbi:head-tail connector protein [Stutzerimonas kunmingensis]|uniref:head-tail connector protein n=1 Tax=Stutzerimonas kunmingensis TaxID=1211807 RepID=UPI00241D9E66|nr:head-tail connector protein [Stutzerimonas kunmingensis]